jgi:hypothetical protein
MVTLEQAQRAGLSVHDVHRLCRQGRWRLLSRSTYLIRPDVPGPMMRRARVRAAVASLGPEAMAVRGIRVTSPVRTVADNLLRVDRFAGVSLLDSALNLGLLHGDDLPAVAAMLLGRRGAVAARPWLAQADCRAQSPLETRVRLRCADGGVAPEELQFAVRDTSGHLLGVADLAWSGAGLLAEADGRGPHGTPDAVHADRRRQNRLINAGWRLLRFTWIDAQDPHYIPHTVKTALRAARRS